jgi:hypothetical protein
MKQVYIVARVYRFEQALAMWLDAFSEYELQPVQKSRKIKKTPDPEGMLKTCADFLANRLPRFYSVPNRRQ